MKTFLTLIAALLVLMPGARAGLLDALGLGKHTTNDTTALVAWAST